MTPRMFVSALIQYNSSTNSVSTNARLRWEYLSGSEFFIVYNEQTYPNFSRLLKQLEVATQASDMSFSVRSDRTGWEYCGSSLSGLFAQRRNLVRPAFYRMLNDILRFNRCSFFVINPPSTMVWPSHTMQLVVTERTRKRGSGNTAVIGRPVPFCA